MNLLSEVKRRNVHRMAALYAVAAWLVMQLTEVTMSLADLPVGIGAVVLALLAIGFPIALVFSWFYELTPEGLSLEKDVDSGDSITHITGRRLDFMIIAVLGAAVILFAYDKWSLGEPTITSVAVLPIKALGADPELGYLADGMTEVLIGELGRIDELRVTSRTSAMQYKETDKVLPVIASELAVDALVEGSIQHFEGKLRIGLQLIDGQTDRQLWSRFFVRNFGDFLTLQGEVANAIAREMKITLTPETEAHFNRSQTTSPEALRFWVIGNHHLKGADEGSFQKALRAFNEAVKRDPEFAGAYAGIAQTYVSLGSWHGSAQIEKILPLARSAADKAIGLDPELSAAHFALAMIHRFDHAWEAAERAYRRGTELSPSDSIGLIEYSNFLTQMGQGDQAIEVAMRAVEIDPLEPISFNELAWASLLGRGDVDAALTQYNKSLQLNPGFSQTHFLLADLYLIDRQIHRAMPHLEQVESTVELQSPTMHGLLGHHYALAGRDDKAKKILSLLLEKMESEHVSAVAIAYLHLGLGNYDEALKWLNTAYEERDSSLVWLKRYWIYDVLRDDARFQDLVGRMNFPN